MRGAVLRAWGYWGRTVLVYLKGVAAPLADDAAEPGLRVGGQLEGQLLGLRQEDAAALADEVSARQHRESRPEAHLRGHNPLRACNAK